MKVAVIGCGTIANAAHIPSYLNNPEAEIKYFCDIIPERAENAVKKYGCGTGRGGLPRRAEGPRGGGRVRVHPQQRPPGHRH